MHIPISLAIPLSLFLRRQAFENYDSCALKCFDEYLSVVSQCDETVQSQQIACVCGNSLYDTICASCIYATCSATILNETAQQHEFNCNLNGSPPALNAQQFYAAGLPVADTANSAFSSILSSLSAATAKEPVATMNTFATETTSSPFTIISIGGGNTTPTMTQGPAQNSATQSASSSATTSSSSSSNSGSSSSSSSNGGSTTNSSSNGDGNTLSTGALVGSIVGSITGAIGSFAGVYFAWKTYKIKKEEKKEKAAADAQAAGMVS